MSQINKLMTEEFCSCNCYININETRFYNNSLRSHALVAMEMKYICDIYNFWSREYILASFKYMSDMFWQIKYMSDIFWQIKYMSDIFWQIKYM